jgi:hypothetical protein
MNTQIENPTTQIQAEDQEVYDVLFRKTRYPDTNVEDIKQALEWFSGRKISTTHLRTKVNGFGVVHVYLTPKVPELMRFLRELTNPAFNPRKLFGDSGNYVGLQMMANFFVKINRYELSSITLCEEFCKSQDFTKHPSKEDYYQCRFLFHPAAYDLIDAKYSRDIGLITHEATFRANVEVYRQAERHRLERIARADAARLLELETEALVANRRLARRQEIFNETRARVSQATL